MFCLEYYWIQMKLLKVQFALCCIKSHFIYVKMINQMFFSAKHYYRLMHDVDKDKFQFRFGKQTTVDFLDLYNGCHINTCQTPTPLNWYNYHLCLFQWSIELKCAFDEKVFSRRDKFIQSILPSIISIFQVKQ